MSEKVVYGSRKHRNKDKNDLRSSGNHAAASITGKTNQNSKKCPSYKEMQKHIDKTNMDPVESEISAGNQTDRYKIKKYMHSEGENTVQTDRSITTGHHDSVTNAETTALPSSSEDDRTASGSYNEDVIRKLRETNEKNVSYIREIEAKLLRKYDESKTLKKKLSATEDELFKCQTIIKQQESLLAKSNKSRNSYAINKSTQTPKERPEEHKHHTHEHHSHHKHHDHAHYEHFSAPMPPWCDAMRECATIVENRPDGAKVVTKQCRVVQRSVRPGTETHPGHCCHSSVKKDCPCCTKGQTK